MKTLLLLLLLGIGGYYWWSQRATPAPAPAPADAPQAPAVAEAPPPVDFAIKMRVKRILDEWKKHSLAAGDKDKHTSMVEIESEINDIRRRLFEQGLHDSQSLRQTMERAALELGYAPDQAKHLTKEVLGGR
jgi:hypothetical protein